MMDKVKIQKTAVNGRKKKKPRIQVSLLSKRKCYYYYYYTRVCCDLPAKMYMTPVTRTALICLLSKPNKPTKAEVAKRMRQTMAHDMERFCIPVTKEEQIQINYNNE